MAPERKHEVVKPGLRSIVSGTLATCTSGAVIGLLDELAAGCRPAYWEPVNSGVIRRSVTRRFSRDGSIVWTLSSWAP